MKKIFLFLFALTFACNNFSGLMAMEQNIGKKRRPDQDIKDLITKGAEVNKGKLARTDCADRDIKKSIQETTGKDKEKIAEIDYFTQLNDGQIFRILINLPAKDIFSFLATNRRFALLNKLLKNSPTPDYMGKDLRLFQQIQCKLATIKCRMLKISPNNLFAHQILSEGKTLSVDLLENLLKILDSDTQRTLSQTYPIFEQTLRDSFGLTFIDYLNQLPDNILINIFSNITDPQQLVNLCRLNNRFCYLITRLTPLTLNFNCVSAKTIEKQGRFFIHYFSKYAEITQEHLIQLLSHFKNIKSLIIENNNINNDFINFLNNHCHNLTKLNLVNCDKLTNLTLDNCPNLTEIIIDACKNLTNLNIDNHPNLITLGLGACDKLTNLNIKCPQLTTLKLFYCRLLTKLNISCPHIKKLFIDSCYELTPEVIQNIQQQYPKLKIIT